MSELIKDELNVLKKLLTNIGNDKDIIYRKILENHKDGKEMRKIHGAGFFCVEDVDELANRDVGLRAMLKRLDKRIEELRTIPKNEKFLYPHSKLMIDELQKIREGTK